jgi:hypothetical protein
MTNSADQLIYELEKKVRDLENYIRLLENNIGDASFLLMDWDGYYDPQTGKGNTKELALLVEDAYGLLQGRSWRDPDPPKKRRSGEVEGQLLLWEDEE